jgi:hypothetical protein
LSNGVSQTIPLPKEPIGREYDRLLDSIAHRLSQPSQAAACTAFQETRWMTKVVETIYSVARAPADQLHLLTRPSIAEHLSLLD